MKQHSFVCLLSFTLLIASSYAAEDVVAQNPSFCIVQVKLTSPYSARGGERILKASTQKQIVKTFDEFTSCSTPGQFAESCTAITVGGVKTGDCYTSMVLYCSGPDTSPTLCKAMDGSDLVGKKIKLRRHEKAVFTGATIGKGTHQTT